ncbi:MAG TPA: iron ABC transporter permease, partial [Planctomycetes bacterium]|nr:iron ABC transporter permease [Planctomycetota bacterium]
GILSGWSGGAALTMLAFAGAVAAGVLVLAIASRMKGAGATAVILAGIMVNAFAGAIVQFVYSRATVYEAYRITGWLIGRIPDDAGMVQGIVVLCLAAAGTAVMLLLARPMNLLAMGETAAAASGVETGRLRICALGTAGFLAALTVAAAGPIGFVGLVVPHAARLVGGADNRWVAPASGLIGAAFLLAADTFARKFAAVTPLPVGVVTGMVGTPVFLLLVMRRRRHG